MNYLSYLLLAWSCLALPLWADGVEVALGVAIGPTNQGAAPPSRGEGTTALQLRAGWDESFSYTQMDQWQVMAQSGTNEELKYAVSALGYQHSWWSDYHGAEAALGAELRVEHYQGRDGLASLAQEQAWMARPWIRAQAGFRGIVIPFLGPRASELMGWLTQGGQYTHPFTRLELAVPLWYQGGEGAKGLLRQMAPRYEVAVQFGMRFGARTAP
jgi:hypothetical protein